MNQLEVVLEVGFKKKQVVWQRHHCNIWIFFFSTIDRITSQTATGKKSNIFNEWHISMQISQNLQPKDEYQSFSVLKSYTLNVTFYFNTASQKIAVT